jgi:glycosyltransferase involved in cell wall biosynthesis
MLRGDEKRGAFQTADAFVLPSHQENFGVAVAEEYGGLRVDQARRLKELEQENCTRLRNAPFLLLSICDELCL